MSRPMMIFWTVTAPLWVLPVMAFVIIGLFVDLMMESKHE